MRKFEMSVLPFNCSLSEKRTNGRTNIFYLSVLNEAFKPGIGENIPNISTFFMILFL